MVDHSQRARLGPYVLVRQLSRFRNIARWLALHEQNQTAHIAFRFPSCLDKSEQRRFVRSIERAAMLRHPHALPIEEMTFGTGGAAWVISPFTGDAAGLATLESVLIAKGGRMSQDEAEHAVRQLLSVSVAGHGRGVHHGPVAIEQVLVDRHGSLLVELYGLERMLAGLERGNEETARDEVLSIAEIAYRLLTGLRAEEPLIPAHRLVKGLDRAWREWLEVGLSPTGGFASAAEAAAALDLPAEAADARGDSPVRLVLSRLGFARRPLG